MGLQTLTTSSRPNDNRVWHDLHTLSPWVLIWPMKSCLIRVAPFCKTLSIKKFITVSKKCFVQNSHLPLKLYTYWKILAIKLFVSTRFLGQNNTYGAVMKNSPCTMHVQQMNINVSSRKSKILSDMPKTMSFVQITFASIIKPRVNRILTYFCLLYMCHTTMKMFLLHFPFPFNC